MRRDCAAILHTFLFRLLLRVLRSAGACSSLTVQAIAIEFHKPIQSTSETRQTTAGWFLAQGYTRTYSSIKGKRL